MNRTSAGRGGRGASGLDSVPASDLRRDDPTPLYQRVAARLRGEIAAGAFPVGTLLPTVKQLSEQLGVSQQTVRQALAQLRSAGLISSRRKGGTRVEAMHADFTGHILRSIRQQLIAYSEAARLKITKKEWVTVRTDLADLLQCPPRSPWLKASGFRYLPGDPTPRIHVDIYINPKFPAVFERINANTISVYSLFPEIYGAPIAEFRQEVRMVTLDDALARALAAPEGAAGMRYVNRFFNDMGEVLEVSVSTHPLRDEDADAPLRQAPVVPVRAKSDPG